VLPWRVLQELDCIKKNENALGYRAREATRWLLEMLSNNHPRLKGQPMTTNNNSTNADDSILKCAMSVKERVNCVVSSLFLMIYLIIYLTSLVYKIRFLT
jgi:predicted ribonuclease YlaK